MTATKPKPMSDAVTPAKVLTWLKMYWLTILFVGGLVGSGLAWAAWELLPAKYESYALLRVASSPFTVTNQKDPTRSRTDFNTYLKTNAKLIRNEFVLNKALNMEVDGRRIIDLPTIKAQVNPIQFLEEELQVVHTDGVEIITLSMKGHNPEDIRRIVNAVQMAYMEEVIEKEIHERQAFLTTVETTLVRLQGDLAKMVGKPDHQPVNIALVGNPPQALPGNVIQQAAANGPPEWVKRTMADNMVKKVASLRENVMEIPLVINSQKAKIASLEKQMAELKAGPPAKELAEAIDRDPEVMHWITREQTLRAKYQREMALYANPTAASVQATLALANEAAAELTKVRDAKHREVALRQGPATALALEIDTATRRLRDMEEKLRADEMRLKEMEAEVAKIPSDPAKIAAEEKKLEKPPLVNPDATMILAQDDIFRDMAHHAAALRMDVNSPKRVSVLQKASQPVQKDIKKQVLVTAFAGLMGFGLVGLMLAGYETKAKKVCNLNELKGATPVPVVGVLPWKDGVRTTDCNEAVDKLRAYVSQTWLARGATTVAVSSPIGEEGKAFCAFSLANSLAAAGQKTLLVDFDLREPSLHTFAGVANGSGVCELLRGESDLRSCVQRLASGLHFLPCGKWSDDARAAAVGGRLESLLSRVKEPFDCVIVHTHAILAAAETVEVARRCEVVLLCTQHRETRTPMLKRATERLATMEVPYTGVVYLGATSQEALC